MNPYTFAAETAAKVYYDRQVALRTVERISLIMQYRTLLDAAARQLADQHPSYDRAVFHQKLLGVTERPCDRRYLAQRIAHYEHQAASSNGPGLRLVHSAPDPQCLGVDDMSKPDEMFEQPIALIGIDRREAAQP